MNKHISTEALETLMRAILDIVRAEKFYPGSAPNETEIFAELAIILYPNPGQLKKVIKTILDTSGQEELRYMSLVEIKPIKENKDEVENKEENTGNESREGTGAQERNAQKEKPGLKNYAGNKPEEENKRIQRNAE